MRIGGNHAMVKSPSPHARAAHPVAKVTRDGYTLKAEFNLARQSFDVAVHSTTLQVNVRPDESKLWPLARRGIADACGRMMAPDGAGAINISNRDIQVGPVHEANSAIPVSSRYSSSLNSNDGACTFSSR